MNDDISDRVHQLVVLGATHLVQALLLFQQVLLDFVLLNPVVENSGLRLWQRCGTLRAQRGSEREPLGVRGGEVVGEFARVPSVMISPNAEPIEGNNMSHYQTN